MAEHVDIRGPPYSAGSVAWTGKLADDDAHVLRVLWKAGCVFYVRAAVVPAEVGTVINKVKKDLLTPND